MPKQKQYALACPACKEMLMSELPCEITFIGCPSCGHEFAAQRPDTIKPKKSKAPAKTDPDADPLPKMR